MSKDPFEDQITIKMEPEIRHVFAHLYYAIEALAHGRKYSALDNLRSVESLIMFDGSEKDWERYYRRRIMAGKKKCKGKKCKGKKK